MYRRGTTTRRALGNGDVLEVLHRANSAGTNCFEYPGHQKGRPVATLNGRQMNASRAAWIVANGDPGDKLVLHTCHNARCINVAHLYLGTSRDNTRDMLEAGRGGNGPQSGQSNGNARLTDADVMAIRQCRAAGDSFKSIAERFSVTISMVEKIIYRKNWNHLP